MELAPIRVNALSPGIIDSGAWDGPSKESFFAAVASANPAWPDPRAPRVPLSCSHELNT